MGVWSLFGWAPGGLPGKGGVLQFHEISLHFLVGGVLYHLWHLPHDFSPIDHDVFYLYFLYVPACDFPPSPGPP